MRDLGSPFRWSKKLSYLFAIIITLNCFFYSSANESVQRLPHLLRMALYDFTFTLWNVVFLAALVGVWALCS